MIDILSDLFILRGIPTHIRSDNGPEFVAKAVQEWIAAVGAKTAYSSRRRALKLQELRSCACPSCHPSPTLRRTNCESDVAIAVSQAIERTVITAAAAPGGRALPASITGARIW
jgi:hypothetical protein